MRLIFISYSRKDVAFVRRLAGDLEHAGYEVWWDISDLRGGDDWVRVIPEAIDKSEYFIVVLSPQSIISEWVRREYTQALHRHKRVIPLMLVNTTVPFSLNTLNYIDFTAEEGYTDSFKSLLRALEYSGELTVAPVTSLPYALGRYTIPITLAVFILLALMALFVLKLPLPSAVPILPTAATTGMPTSSAAISLPRTVMETMPPGSTYIPSSTQTPAFQRLTFCVNSRSVNSINVRSGPGIDYARIGDPLVVGSCLDFRGQNEEGIWLLVAPNQSDPFLRQYEGGWIFRELLGLGLDGPIDLPAVTLTPTPTPSHTPARTSTPTRSSGSQG